MCAVNRTPDLILAKIAWHIRLDSAPNSFAHSTRELSMVGQVKPLNLQNSINPFGRANYLMFN